MNLFTIKRGDTSPALRYALLPEALDLTGAVVVFNIRGADPILDRAKALIVTTSPPVVEYQWQPGDTDITGLHRAEFEVTWPDETVETFPNGGYLLINIVQDLG